MLGAIIGDIVGSKFEFGPIKTTDFPLFSEGCRFTDDTVMTIAVAQALLDSEGKNDEEIKQTLIDSMKHYGHLYPHAGYGGSFGAWLNSDDSKAYNSFGNGSAMRVSSVGWLYPTLEETLKIAKLTAAVTHNHPEGIKGAQATAAAIFLARNKTPKNEIKEYIEKTFGYNLNFTLDEIRPDYCFDVTCQGSVPEAIKCFLEANSFEETIRLAISLGGDADTQGAIAGSIAEAYYGIPETIAKKALEFIPENFASSVKRLKELYK